MSWEKLSMEGRQLMEYLGDEISGPLSVPVEGVGEGSVDGSTRKAVVEQLEGLRFRLLEKVLQECTDRDLRAVLAWPIRDKLSSAFLLSIPGPHTSLSTPVFREAMAMVLCLPSPACRDRVGQQVGSGRVDP